MFKKIYRIKNIESVLGAAGVVYLLLLALAAAILIRFLVLQMVNASGAESGSQSSLPVFDLEVSRILPAAASSSSSSSTDVRP